ncbi:hypothetical protein [Sporosarcina phage Lietuvens]|nr:hypothetical protein [Sporosarcina phage Lietuvens]
MADFVIDFGKLTKAIKQSPEAAGRGATRAMGDIKNDWQRGAVDIAPMDSTNLRQQIKGEVKGGLGGNVEIHANATQATGRRFNYSYYIHEQNAGGKSLKLAGAEKKFLDVALEKRKGEYKRWLEEEIKAELRKAGW